MAELRNCCNCDETYHYYDGTDENDDYTNDPDYCNECTALFMNRENIIALDDYEQEELNDGYWDIIEDE